MSYKKTQKDNSMKSEKTIREQYEKFNKEIEIIKISNSNRHSRAEDYNKEIKSAIGNINVRVNDG